MLSSNELIHRGLEFAWKAWECRSEDRGGGGTRKEKPDIADELKWLDLVIECFSKAGSSGNKYVSKAQLNSRCTRFLKELQKPTAASIQPTTECIFGGNGSSVHSRLEVLGGSTVKIHSPDKMKVKLTNTSPFLSASFLLSFCLSFSQREKERERQRVTERKRLSLVGMTACHPAPPKNASRVYSIPCSLLLESHVLCTLIK